MEDDDLPDPASKCECDVEIDLEKSLCFVEGNDVDQEIADDVPELADLVWFGVKPPVDFRKMQPFVSARQLEICRAQLTGKVKPKEDLVALPPGKSAKQGVKKKKSAVRFLSKTMMN